MTLERIKAIRNAAEEGGKIWDQDIIDLCEELTRLKTPPKCPKCGSDDVVPYKAEGKWIISCFPCQAELGGFDSIDAALNAWRKV